MIIEYLRELESLNSQNLQNIFPNEPLPVNDILRLEQLYNNGKPFPKVLRELLYIAGNRCSVMSLTKNSPFLYQSSIRDLLTARNRTISRPFFGFDSIDRSLFTVVFLDGTDDDPEIVHFDLSEPISSEYYMLIPDITLSKLINSRIEDVKRGYNYN
jgi:hypothetical protein